MIRFDLWVISSADFSVHFVSLVQLTVLQSNQFGSGTKIVSGVEENDAAILLHMSRATTLLSGLKVFRLDTNICDFKKLA